MCQTTYACSAVHIREHNAVHKQNTLFNNELKTEMITIIPLANRARSHIALTRPSWVSLASGEREAQPLGMCIGIKMSTISPLFTSKCQHGQYHTLKVRLAPTWQYFGTITCDGLHGIMKLYIDKP